MSSVAIVPPVVAITLAPSVTLPWAMSGCWEHELFIPKATAPVTQQTALPR